MFDILSKAEWPASALSNFAAHEFLFRGIKCASMEGLLQSLKFSDPETQIIVCSMTGKEAKQKGLETDWRPAQTLWWQGQPMDRHGPEYQAFLDEAFRALFLQNAEAKKALLATGTAELKHSIGVQHPKETILTESEFCSRLMRIRIEISPKPPNSPKPKASL